MGVRAFRYYAITATDTAQPCFGTTMASAPVISGENSPSVITVADSSMFLQRDPIILDPYQSNAENTYVESVIDGTHISAYVRKAHSAYSTGPGGFVVLGKSCASVTVNGLDGSAGDYFFGIGPSFKDGTSAGSGSAGLIFIARKTPASYQPPYFSSSNIYGLNAVNSAEFWIQGTVDDVFLPSWIET